MMTTRKTKTPPILMIYLGVIAVMAALVSTQVHAPKSAAVAAQFNAPVLTASL